MGHTNMIAKIANNSALSNLLFAGIVGMLCLLSAPLAAQQVAVIHCQGSCPAYDSAIVANRSNVVIHHVYAAGLNNQTAVADWVAYHLDGDAVGVASLLPRNWQSDRLLRFSDAGDLIEVGGSDFSLAEISVDVSPYAGLGDPSIKEEETVRMAPITSFADSPYWSELNNVSNMVPMPANLRLGPWLRLEQSLNQFVEANEDLFVVAGPLYLINQPLSTSLFDVNFGPAAYFKIVSNEEGYVAFMFTANIGRFDSFCESRVELEQIELMSGLEVFPGREPQESFDLLNDLGCSN